jgi:hypothetical protein
MNWWQGTLMWAVGCGGGHSQIASSSEVPQCWTDCRRLTVSPLNRLGWGNDRAASSFKDWPHLKSCWTAFVTTIFLFVLEVTHVLVFTFRILTLLDSTHGPFVLLRNKLLPCVRVPELSHGDTWLHYHKGNKPLFWMSVRKSTLFWWNITTTLS